MSYDFYEGMIDEHAEMLQNIAVCIAAGQSAVFRVDSFKSIKNEVHKMHNLLKACEVLAYEQAGRYTHLRNACTVSPTYNPDSPGFEVRPKRGAPLSPVKATIPSEKDIIKRLEAAETPNREHVRFLPLPGWDTDGEAQFWDTMGMLSYWPDGEFEDVFKDSHFLQWEKYDDGAIGTHLQWYPLVS